MAGRRERGVRRRQRVATTGRCAAWSGVALCALLTGVAGVAIAELPVEQIGRVERLETPFGPHWVWASDAILSRIALVDLGTGRLLGVVDGGWGLTTGLFPSNPREFYVPETHYSRGSRGERTDVLTFYDSVSLAPSAEVILPPKRAINPLPSANAALSDDGRFAAIFNMTPATSLSIVDVERRSFVGEVTAPGCGLVYGAGARRFVMLCSDGTMLVVGLDEEGREASKKRTAPFFDAEEDPVTEKAVRFGDRWLFVSFEGKLHEVDVSGAEVRFEAPWSLIGPDDRAASWRIGGAQHLALHQATGRLYVLMHQGGPDSHKDPGNELWVYDIEKRERIQRITLRSPGVTYLGVSLEFGVGWIWPLSRLYDWVLAAAGQPLWVGEIQVTQDDAPLLVTASNFSGSLAIYDALTGEFLRRVISGNMTTLILQTPWSGEGSE